MPRTGEDNHWRPSESFLPLDMGASYQEKKKKSKKQTPEFGASLRLWCVLVSKTMPVYISLESEAGGFVQEEYSICPDLKESIVQY